jgi:hypothetical protein
MRTGAGKPVTELWRSWRARSLDRQEIGLGAVDRHGAPLPGLAWHACPQDLLS